VLAELRAAKLPRTYWLVWWGTLVNRLGGFIVPLLTIYLMKQRNLDAAEAGGVAMGFGIGQVGASIVGGQLADRVGRRASLLISLFGGSIAMVALGQARDLLAIRLLVIAVGFIGEIYRPAVAAIVSDVVEPAKRQVAFGYLYWAVNLGFAAASAIGGLLADHDFQLLFYFDAATTAAYGLIVAFYVPETRPANPPARDPEVVAAESPWRDPQLLLLVLLGFASAFMILQIGAPLSAHMTWQGFAPSTYGFVMAGNGVLIVLLQPRLSRWSAQHDASRVLAGASLLFGVGMLAHGLAPIALAHLAAVAIWTTGEILDSPTKSAVLAGLAPTHARGRYQASMVFAWGLAQIAAPKLGTWIWEYAGHGVLWGGCFGLSIGVAALYLATGPSRRRRLATAKPP